MTPKLQATKIDKLDLIKIKKKIFFNGYHQESERPTNQMGENICPHKNLYTKIHNSIIYNRQNWKQPKYSSTDE